MRVGVKALPDEAWLALVQGFYPIWSSWRGCGGSAWWGLAGVDVEALLNGAWFASV